MSEQITRDIAALAELFKAGGWSELRVEGGGISLLFSNDPDSTSNGGSALAAPAAPEKGARPPQAPAAAGQKVDPVPDRREKRASGGVIDPDWVAVTAPNLGTFYRSPKPGAAPFVEVGQRVEPSTEICLIEVMKLFTSVKAGLSGTVRHVAVDDGALVEGGQTLAYIEIN
ncbi:acetyl-CoA carboxylase biotin carboxyl carrier protein [Sphingomonas sp. ID0503]|uniref:acetyl-CoA carboxylase biotin carboxyl carrier protein n=1 Tax=Sphingomonas sp. ID0503 TaxID=3399691 RepID=UPI003AFA2021